MFCKADLHEIGLNLTSDLHSRMRNSMAWSFHPSYFSDTASGLVDKVEAEAGKRILAKYPDIKDVHELLKEQRLPRCHISSTASFILTSKRQLPTLWYSPWLLLS